MLDIQPLTQAQIGTLVAPLPDSIVQHIQTQAAGNPFFAEELARFSNVELSTTSSAEGWQNIPSAEKIVLPETITAVLERRMSHLSDAWVSTRITIPGRSDGYICRASGHAGPGEGETYTSK